MSIEPWFVPYQALACLPGRRVTLLAPHADDEVFGCAGSLALLAAAGAQIRVCVVTSGDACGSELTDIVRQREGESTAAAALLGYPPPQFWRLPDGRLSQNQTALAARLEQHLTQWRPDLILAPSPWEMHPDHRALAETLLARLDLLAPGCRLGLYEVGNPLQPNALVGLNAETLARKQQAMACFVSQEPLNNYAEVIGCLNRFRTFTLHGFAAAEAYVLLTGDEARAFFTQARPDRLSLALHQANQALAQAQQARQQAETALAAIQASRSWRWSAPLRWLKRRANSGG
ncbi:MAG: PIG-L family deacetylase [Gammaproteobacteria bacterium SHHR-1]|uniref:PIG-L deacetylase family protein n=1 Tax=Magnetovirga frankeli TaxID=947516 RepID=UPI001AF874E4|nr:PIG-L family deacetylase [gamma proteobacterium SS-5]